MRTHSPAFARTDFESDRRAGGVRLLEKDSDIALDPHNPFIFYVGLAHGGVFKTEDPENHPELQRYVGNVELGVWELRHGESSQTADRAQ